MTSALMLRQYDLSPGCWQGCLDHGRQQCRPTAATVPYHDAGRPGDSGPVAHCSAGHGSSGSLAGAARYCPAASDR